MQYTYKTKKDALKASKYRKHRGHKTSITTNKRKLGNTYTLRIS